MNDRTQHNFQYISMGNSLEQTPQRTPNVTSRMWLTFHAYFHVTKKGSLQAKLPQQNVTSLGHFHTPGQQYGGGGSDRLFSCGYYGNENALLVNGLWERSGHGLRSETPWLHTSSDSSLIALLWKILTMSLFCFVHFMQQLQTTNITLTFRFRTAIFLRKGNCDFVIRFKEGK